MDETVFSWLFSFGQYPASKFFFIFGAKYLPYVMVALFLFLLFREKEWKKRFYFFGYAILATLLSRGIITEIVRFFISRERPFVALSLTPSVLYETTVSFPSGHAAFLFSLALVVWLIHRKWGITFLILAAFSSIARIGAGLHWPSDIAGGALLSAIVFFALYASVLSPKKFFLKDEKKEEQKNPA